jgi:hypothetical protein
MARHYLEEVLALVSPSGSESVRASALNLLGGLCIGSGEIATGMQHAEEALAIAVECDDRLLQGLAYGVLYRGAKGVGDVATALEYLERSLMLAREAVAGDDIRFSELPIQRELEEEWRRRAIHQMALPTGGAGHGTVEPK